MYLCNRTPKAQCSFYAHGWLYNRVDGYTTQNCTTQAYTSQNDVDHLYRRYSKYWEPAAASRLGADVLHGINFSLCTWCLQLFIHFGQWKGIGCIHHSIEPPWHWSDWLVWNLRHFTEWLLLINTERGTKCVVVGIWISQNSESISYQVPGLSLSALSITTNLHTA